MLVDLGSEEDTGQGPGDAGTFHLIPVQAIASWSALLGTQDDEETIAAILHVRENGEPSTDPETGRNAWTSSYEQLEMELAAETAASEAEARVSAMRISSAYAASRAKAAAPGAMDGRAQTRAALGLPSSPGISTMSANGEPQVRGISLSQQAADAVAGAASALSGDDAQTKIARAREAFLSDLRHGM